MTNPMKKLIPLLSLAAVVFGVLPAQAQLGGGHGAGPQFNSAMAKLFGDNQTFTANMELQTAEPTSGNMMAIPGKMTFDSGKTRFEMNMADIKGGSMPANMAAQLKAMGMDSMVAITRPDLNVSYLIYPGMKSYLEHASEDSASTNLNDFKMDVTAIGKETLAGHDCVKNKVVVTEKDGTTHESTVWNATDLKKFPVQIESNEQGRKNIMTFTGVSFAKPDASSFAAPAGYAKYDNMQAMMQQM